MPLVVRPTSLMPGTGRIMATRRGRSRRISGSPPVKRILSIPSGATISTKWVISSKESNSCLSMKTTSSGMQYVQRTVLFFPNRHEFLEPIDRKPARFKCLGAVRATDGDGNADVADVKMPDTVLHDNVAERPARARLRFDLGHLFFGHRRVCFIIERDRDTVAGQIAHGTQEQDD